MALPLHRQPFKGIYYLSVFLATVFVRLPFWILIFLLTGSRPRPSWTFSRIVIVNSIRVVVSAIGTTHTWRDKIHTVEEFVDRADEYGLVFVEPVPELIQGDIKDLAARNGVEAVPIPGFWYGKRGDDGKAGQKAQSGEKIIYQIHGGGWIEGESNPKAGHSQ
ncbi:hypothetical protein NM688_g2614 [Phlebia brevispora]|uniref:Uncharacterized protein n=1 Tax=Phlebia brevispora TaxID=194682 RepID=A0ACC1T827_9APHY|nr:hypothetical protein NM688_g2614 [Phlebia brevispora]